MFKIIEDPQFDEDVTVETPDGTGWITQKLRTRFRVLPVSKLVELETAGADAFVDGVVVGFFDLTNEQGDALDGMGEWRDLLLGLPNVRGAIVRAYTAAVVRLTLGNSASSAAAGPTVN